MLLYRPPDRRANFQGTAIRNSLLWPHSVTKGLNGDTERVRKKFCSIFWRLSAYAMVFKFEFAKFCIDDTNPKSCIAIAIPPDTLSFGSILQ